MAKPIKVTPEIIKEAMEAFAEAIAKQKMTDGKITFTKQLGAVSRKATVVFTDLAWFKMQTLIQNLDKEVGWHGVARRGDDPEKDEYIISDIVVYPQTVTGATVNTDQTEYENWLNGLDDDTFNNLRMQGHSHVNMGVTPSSIDLDLYEEFLARLREDMFYIFLIYNKRGDKTYKIYDMAKNLLFETADVTVEIEDTGLGLNQLLSDMKEKVKDKPVAPAANTAAKWNGYGGGYQHQVTATGAANGYSGAVYTPGGAKNKAKEKDKREKKPVQISTLDYYDEYYDDGYYGGYYGGSEGGKNRT